MNFLPTANKVKVAAAFVDGVNDATGRSKKATLDDWVPGTAGNTTSTVEISISGRNLADKDVLSKSDPMCVVFNRPPGSKNWVQFMRTEVIENDLNPDFVQKITMEYKFEQVQALRFEMYDIDSTTAKLSSQDTIGTVECTLGQIVSAGEEGLRLELNCLNTLLAGSKVAGSIILIAEELSSEKDEVELKLGGHAVGAWACCFPPKSYFAISKLNDAGIYLVVHRSVASRGTNPQWKPVKISSRLLCGGELDRELKIEIFQRKLTGTLVQLGYTLITLNQLLRQSPQDRMQLMTPNLQQCQSSIRVITCSMRPQPTFLDYVQSGTQIMCCFSIDFTCSNGNPEDQESLHYLSNSGNQPNPYEQAISAVGSIIKDYDNSNLFPTYGFGARVPPRGDISHNFNVTLTNSPNCNSVPGVLEAYRNCIGKIELFGPTYFAPVITTMAQIAKQSKNGENYYILVIITDGVITDMAKTKKAIVEAAMEPLSIIIIGVGEADFDAMQELDGDAVRISHKGKFAERDIVQFVAYRSARSWMTNTGEQTFQARDIEDMTLATGALVPGVEGGSTATGLNVPDDPSIRGSHPGSSMTLEEHKTPVKTAATLTIPGAPEDKEEKTNRLAQGQLAQEVLMEIPIQITGYMKAKNILPAQIKSAKGGDEKKKEGEEGAPPPVPVEGAPATTTA